MMICAITNPPLLLLIGSSKCGFRISLELIPDTEVHASEEAKKRFSAAC